MSIIETYMKSPRTTPRRGGSAPRAVRVHARRPLSLRGDEILPHRLLHEVGREQALAEECRSCQIRRICGGGLYGHRYRPGTGFANPSVYCPDLMGLISHIHQTMRADIQARLLRRAPR